MQSRRLLLIGVLVISACDGRTTDPSKGSVPPNPPSAGSGPTPAGTEAGVADAPYVRGSVVIVGPWQEERLAAGFAGLGANGKPHSNMASNLFAPDWGAWVESTTSKPQITALDSRGRTHREYRHTHLPPGEYVVYVHRGGVPAAWKKVTVKTGDQQTVDLTIDPARTGAVTVTLPDAEANEPLLRRLLMIPADLDLPGTTWHDAFQAVELKDGEKVTTVTGVPAGKYRFRCGRSQAEVEVTPGQTATVTLVRAEPGKK